MKPNVKLDFLHLPGNILEPACIAWDASCNCRTGKAERIYYKVYEKRKHELHELHEFSRIIPWTKKIEVVNWTDALKTLNVYCTNCRNSHSTNNSTYQLLNISTYQHINIWTNQLSSHQIFRSPWNKHAKNRKASIGFYFLLLLPFSHMESSRIGNTSRWSFRSRWHSLQRRLILCNDPASIKKASLSTGFRYICLQDLSIL